MMLEKCKCSYQFTYGKILKSILSCYSPIECPNCKTNYKIAIYSRSVGMGFFAFWFVRDLRKNSELSECILWLILFGLLFASFLIIPFIATLKECPSKNLPENKN
ncbi:TIGR04104 family putative zinc finger protein [Desulforamulus aeronauticus]|uniref:Cxxc_20_cxxc protein n=1 Tax=Desulforamulus aeronauticus DSM 10349 TaxID=1121421 RepID=A0A1M6QCD8_9FIRM|nr:cxxc_20_cxxc protein [Desulforamulus aeronauticus DSM 10349]